MTNFIGIGLTGLQAFQRSLATTSHNIANVNTDGYSRQRVDLTNVEGQFTGGGFIGNGVRTETVERLFDQFLNNEVRSSSSATAQLNVFHDFASQVDNRLADPATGLAPGLQEFFNAVQTLADDPGSIPARQLLVSNADILVDRFHALNQSLESLDGRINQEVGLQVGNINALASSIADLNVGIQRARAQGNRQEPNDLLDQRDRTITELAQIVGVSVVPQDDGAFNIFIGNGQPLVLGRDTVTLSAESGRYDARRVEVAANGIRITGALVGGRIGGLLDFRNQILDPAFNSLGRVAMGLAGDFNDQHSVGLDLDGNLGSNFFVEPGVESLAANTNAGTGSVAGTISDTDALTTSDYELRFDGGTAYTLTRLSDRQTFAIDTAVPASLTVDGFTLGIGAGAAVGDTFRILPTRQGAAEIDRSLVDVRRIAAAGALRASEATNANGLPLNNGSGVITQPVNTANTALPLAGTITLTFDANALGAGVPGFVVAGGPGGTLAYDPATESDGKTFNFPGFGDMTFQVSGVPAGGDAFVIGNNSGAVSDNRNVLVLAQLQVTDRLAGGTANYEAAYGQLVSSVGSRTNQADINRAAQEGLLNQAKQAQQNISGVSLDEEAANLVRFQQAYQASAQVVSVANTLFSSLLNAVG